MLLELCPDVDANVEILCCLDKTGNERFYVDHVIRGKAQEKLEVYYLVLCPKTIT